MMGCFFLKIFIDSTRVNVYKERNPERTPMKSRFPIKRTQPPKGNVHESRSTPRPSSRDIWQEALEDEIDEEESFPTTGEKDV